MSKGGSSNEGERRLLEDAGDAPINRRPVAKDGYPLPPSQSAPRPAVLVFDPGEIYDFEYTPVTAEELTLRFGPGPPPTVSGAIHVR